MSKELEIPELGLVALLRYAWRQLTSMRTALILLMLMGIADWETEKYLILKESLALK